MNVLVGASEPEAPPPDPAHRPAAFFGLDTLIPGSSLFLLAQGLHQRDFYGRGDILGFAWKNLVFGAGRSTSPQVQTSQHAALAFVQGKHRPQLRALAREIADERIFPQVYPDLAQLIEGHRAAGVLTFVATAAPAELAEIVAQGLGMTGGLGTAAEVDESERYSGRLIGSVLQGTAKASAVESHATEAGIDLSRSVAYSDSVNDLPLLELVGSAEVVNPDRQLRRVARQRGWPAVPTTSPPRTRVPCCVSSRAAAASAGTPGWGPCSTAARCLCARSLPPTACTSPSGRGTAFPLTSTDIRRLPPTSPRVGPVTPCTASPPTTWPAWPPTWRG
jgi:HAD superfamily hydrolase (TIGR01490 family)